MLELHPGMSVQQQMDALMENTHEVISEGELEDKLARSLRDGRPLRVKLGLDPSAPDIHLGHTVVLRKMRQFQDLGHQVVCLIGDFTGRVGDPSGASQTRRQLTEDEVKENARTYEDQVFHILDREKTVVDFNSRWLGALNFAEVVELASNITVARMLERNDFSQRMAADQAIYVHEFFYPLMQGYDSVALETDVELGGTDQKFNLMMARDIQRAYGVEPEIAMLMPVLEGTDGERKMSKSLGNYIGVTDAPDDMYGKVMSIPDGLIIRYLKLLSVAPEDEIRSIQNRMEDGRLNPRNAKAQLARNLVASYHGEEKAMAAEEYFTRVFTRGGIPEDLDEFCVRDLTDSEGSIWLVRLLTSVGFASSNSEARRLIQQGAVSIDGERIDDVTANVLVRDGAVLKVGKRRFARLRL